MQLFDNDRSYNFISDTISFSTRLQDVKPPIMQHSPTVHMNEQDGILNVYWSRMGQDISQLIIQISEKIPPNWHDIEHDISNPSISDEKHISTSDLKDGTAYQLRIWFKNDKGNGTSQVLSFIVPFQYLSKMEVIAEDVDMSDLTPSFHAKIFSYAIMVDETCEDLRFAITPISKVTKIESPYILNGSDTLDIASIENDDYDESTGAETEMYTIGPPGNVTRFTFHVGGTTKYEILIIRGRQPFGIPRQQRFDPPVLPPCPKQKRIVIQYVTFWVKYKEYIIGFGVFLIMIFIKDFEKSTRKNIGKVLNQIDKMRNQKEDDKNYAAMIENEKYTD